MNFGHALLFDHSAVCFPANDKTLGTLRDGIAIVYIDVMLLPRGFFPE